MLAEQAFIIRKKRFAIPAAGTFIVAALILSFGFYILYPITLIFVNSFNIAAIAQTPEYSLDNWRAAFSEPGSASQHHLSILYLYGYRFPGGGAHCLDTRSNRHQVQSRARVSFLGFVYASTSVYNDRLDIPARPLEWPA